jgi:hypothetical protein
VRVAAEAPTEKLKIILFQKQRRLNSIKSSPETNFTYYCSMANGAPLKRMRTIVTCAIVLCLSQVVKCGAVNATTASSAVVAGAASEVVTTTTLLPLPSTPQATTPAHNSESEYNLEMS